MYPQQINLDYTDSAEIALANNGRQKRMQMTRINEFIAPACGLHQDAKAILEAIPTIAFFVHADGQLIIGNKAFFQALQPGHICDFIGLFPGTALCNGHKSTQSSSQDNTCPQCQLLSAIKEVFTYTETPKNPVRKDLRITRDYGISEEYADIVITVSQTNLESLPNCALVSLKEVSHIKHRKALERVFLHDLSNTVGGLAGLMDYATQLSNLTEIQELLEQMNKISTQIVSELKEHSILLSAEDGNIKPNYSTVLATAIIKHSIIAVSRHPSVEHVKLVMDPTSTHHHITTDCNILNRVLGNMIKNAAEASSAGDTVTIGCTMEQDQTIYWVHNVGVIPKEVQLQMFRRSFSTKGSNRGLGTYSIKIFTEKYLNGSVSFSSNEDTQTVFRIHLPVGE